MKPADGHSRMIKMMVVVMMRMRMFHLYLCSVPMDQAGRWTWQGDDNDDDGGGGGGDDSDGNEVIMMMVMMMVVVEVIVMAVR